MHIDANKRQDGNSALRDNNQNDIHTRDDKRKNRHLSTISFVTIFGILILICSITFKQDFYIFINWNEIGVIGIIQLGAAITFCFFIPGYGIVLILTKKYKIDLILAVLLAYLLNMLITGLTAYISAISFDVPIAESRYLFIGVYLSILVSFVIFIHRIELGLQ